MKDETHISQQELFKVARYCPDTGVFTALVKVGKADVGQSVGHINSCGYLVAFIYGRSYYLHRLAWLYTHGVLPTKFIDHINACREDNRICNLRDVSNAENQQNVRGVKGVYQHKQSGKWHARISTAGVRTMLGSFNTMLEASTAYLAARDSLHTHYVGVHSLV